MRIEDIDITQESVEEFFDKIDVDALAKSIEISLASYPQIKVKAEKEEHYNLSSPKISYNLENINNTSFEYMGEVA